jgi:heterotetrameric sarcosine oxidase gamma subunit
MFRRHLAQNATFSQDGDWEVATVYTAVADETRALATTGGMADVSSLGKLAVRGRSVGAAMTKLTGLGAPEARSAMRGRLNGATILACRLAPDEVLVITPGSMVDAIDAMLRAADEATGCAHVTDLTSAWAAIDLIGPCVPGVLAKLVPVDLTAHSTPPLAVARSEVAGTPGIVIRLEHALPAFRLLVGRECGEFVWDTLLEAGADLGLVPVGAQAHRRVLQES